MYNKTGIKQELQLEASPNGVVHAFVNFLLLHILSPWPVFMNSSCQAWIAGWGLFTLLNINSDDISRMLFWLSLVEGMVSITHHLPSTIRFLR